MALAVSVLAQGEDGDELKFLPPLQRELYDTAWKLSGVGDGCGVGAQGIPNEVVRVGENGRPFTFNSLSPLIHIRDENLSRIGGVASKVVGSGEHDSTKYLAGEGEPCLSDNVQWACLVGGSGLGNSEAGEILPPRPKGLQQVASGCSKTCLLLPYPGIKYHLKIYMTEIIGFL